MANKYLLTYLLFTGCPAHFSEIEIQSDPAIPNTQGKQKLDHYSRGSLYPNVYYIKSSRREMKKNTLDLKAVSSHLVVDITEFDCIQILRKPFGQPAGKKCDKSYIDGPVHRPATSRVPKYLKNLNF